MILPTNMGIVISHYKDPYEPISTMECHKAFAQPFCRWPSSPKPTTFVSPPPCVCMVCIKGTDLIPC